MDLYIETEAIALRTFMPWIKILLHKSNIFWNNWYCAVFGSTGIYFTHSYKGIRILYKLIWFVSCKLISIRCSIIRNFGYGILAG